MVRLIDDLLDVIAHQPQQDGAARERARPRRPWSSRRVETSRPLIDERRPRVSTVALPDAPVHLDADLTRLAQVFGNLLSNGAKYTARAAAGIAHRRARRRRRGRRHACSDNGIGIAAEALPRHLRHVLPGGPLARARARRPRHRPDAGQGLVEMHGGTRRRAERRPGKGSTFIVRLPLARGAGDAAPEPRAGRGGAGAGAGACSSSTTTATAPTAWRCCCSSLGHEAHVAHDGAGGARARRARSGPTSVLLDLGMPRPERLRGCRRIRARGLGARRSPIVALTGWGQDDDRQRSTEAGFDGHLVKPVVFGELTALARRVAALDWPASLRLHLFYFMAITETELLAPCRPWSTPKPARTSSPPSS